MLQPEAAQDDSHLVVRSSSSLLRRQSSEDLIRSRLGRPRLQEDLIDRSQQARSGPAGVQWTEGIRGPPAQGPALEPRSTRPTLTVRGKGRFGGKFLTIPMDPMTGAVLLKWVEGKGPDEGVCPAGHSVADAELAALGRVCDVPVRAAGHVLRRSFGRLAYRAGVPPPTIQRIYGHVSIDQTLHYVGADQEGMAEGFAVFDQQMRSNYSEMSVSASQRQTAF